MQLSKETPAALPVLELPRLAMLRDERFLAGWTALSFGLTFTLFGALYAQDIRMLSRAPEILWYAMCGQPLPDGSTGPLLFGIGFAGAMAGALLLLVRPMR
ncbi:MAG: hypothetical protein ABIQ99_11200 [Thermoflexales bacterium]